MTTDLDGMFDGPITRKFKPCEVCGRVLYCDPYFHMIHDLTKVVTERLDVIEERMKKLENQTDNS